MRRTLRWYVKPAQAHSSRTPGRLLKPGSFMICRNNHAIQAIQPGRRSHPKSATAAERPIVAVYPQSPQRNCAVDWPPDREPDQKRSRYDALKKKLRWLVSYGPEPGIHSPSW